MPKFLDVPQWYSSSGFLTSSVDSYSYLITVRYQDSSETNEVMAYIPISLSDTLTSFDPPLAYFSIKAALSQKNQNVPCLGIMRKGEGSNAICATLTYAEISNTHVVFHANYVSTSFPYKITNTVLSMNLSDRYTSTLIVASSNSGYLVK